MNNNEVTLEVPIALQELILTSNELLKAHQKKMMEKIQSVPMGSRNLQLKIL